MIKKVKTFLRRNREITKMDVDMEEMQKMIENGAILVDVRSKQEYNEGHLEKAISIPEYELLKRASKELKEKNSIIVVYCDSGTRSRKAKKKLERMGYTKIYNLYNGLENY